MSMDESDFHEAADTWLDQLFELLESEDAEAKLDIDLEEGVMEIAVDEDHTFVLSKHAPSVQLWLSSPLSGGLHFDPVDEGSDWTLNDGRRLSIVLSEELKHLTGEEYTPNVV